MKKVLFSTAAITIAVGGFLATQAKADTFYGVLVPMPTPVTLTSSETSLIIGTSTTLTYGGGDGTGGYRFNNSSNGFCSISSIGVVTANFPGACSFSVTRLASGKYLDTTSQVLNITSLPEPDKSVISTPSPDPTPTQSPRPTPTPTASAPQPSPAPVVVREQNSDTQIKAPVVVPLKKVSSVKAGLVFTAGKPSYKFTWGANPSAISYSINIVTPDGKKSFTTKTTDLNLDNLVSGSYSIEIQAIDATGKLSTPSRSSFKVPAPKPVKLITTTSLSKPVISAALAASLDKFALQTTPGTPFAVTIEYSKSTSNDRSVKIFTDLIKKYLAEKREGSEITVGLTPVKGNGSLAIIKGLGEKKSASLTLRR
jgi:hypothetical protein